MWNTSRGLRETVIRAMAKVGLVWAVAVLGGLFMVMGAQGQHEDGYALSSAGADARSTAVSATSGGAPRTAGLALALVLIGGGVTVLAVGASRGDRGHRGDRDLERKFASEPDLALDLPYARGLSLVA